MSTSPSHRWTKQLAKVPLVVRILFVVWLFFSFAFNFGEPSSTANLSPLARFIVLLPMAAVSFGLSIFILWSGCRTLFRTSKSVVGNVPEQEANRVYTFNFIGGIGALNIYMVAYSLIVFASAKPFGGYAIGIGLSCVMCAVMAFALFKRSPHPKDVKIFLWGSLGVTGLFGIIMATVAVPPL